MRRIVILAALAAALAACGEKVEPQPGTAKLEPFTVLLDYFPNADHAGIYAAQAAGLYAKAGLDVKIQAPPDPSAPLKLLQAGRTDVAISYEPELMLARDAGAADLVAVAALVQAPLTSLMALPSAKVASPKDLAGKRVGTSGIPYQSAYLKTILAKAGVDPGSVKETNVGFNLVPAMLSKKADATLGAFWNYEGVDLQRRGKKPVILRMEQLGVPTYDELIVVARHKDLNEAGASRLRRGRPQAAPGRSRGRRRRAREGRQGARPRAAGGGRPGDAAGVLPHRQVQAVGLHGAGRVGALRALDAREPAAHAAALGRSAADGRVPARGVRRRIGIRLSRRYSPARPAHGA
jgi:putative hydroxymethylpyrimidine transport system substrate-binding protein